MKKKILRFVAAALLVVAIVTCFTACSKKLEGTYTSTGLISQSFTFDKDNKVVMSAFGINAEGTYVIEENMITITYSLGSLSYDWQKSFEKDGDTITIDGTEFIKQ